MRKLKLFTLLLFLAPSSCRGRRPKAASARRDQHRRDASRRAESARTSNFSPAICWKGGELGQRGGDIAAEYIGTQFALYGLKPAGDDGTLFSKCADGGREDPAGDLFQAGAVNGESADAQESRRFRNQQREPNGDRRYRRAHRVRRLRHHRAGIQLGRLQGRRSERQGRAAVCERTFLR